MVEPNYPKGGKYPDGIDKLTLWEARGIPYFANAASKCGPDIIFQRQLKRRSSEIPVTRESKSIIKTILKPFKYLWNHL